MLVSEQRALMWEANKKKLVLVDFMNDSVLWESKVDIASRCSPSLFANCWVLFKAQNELVTFEEKSTDLMVVDLSTGLLFFDFPFYSGIFYLEILSVTIFQASTIVDYLL